MNTNTIIANTKNNADLLLNFSRSRVLWKYFFFSTFFFLNGCTNGIKTIQTIKNEAKNTKIEIETISYGTGEGLTGSQPKFIKIKLKEYDSLNRLIYESYKEKAFSGCLVETERWKVVTKMTTGHSNELELLSNNKFKVTYKNQLGKIDSTQIVTNNELHNISWLNQNE